MGGIKRDATDKLKVLRAAVADEILSMSDDEILSDAKNAGIDPKEVGSSMRTKALDIIANARKQRLKDARKRLDIAKTVSTVKRPAVDIEIEEKKRRILALFASPNSRLSLAFRNGERQSESDWESLWDDLIEMGLIKDEQSED
jgi:hypothetical protein